MTSENPISGTLWPEASFCFEAGLPGIGDLYAFLGTFPAKTWLCLPRIASSDRFTILSAGFSGRARDLGIRPASGQDQS